MDTTLRPRAPGSGEGTYRLREAHKKTGGARAAGVIYECDDSRSRPKVLDGVYVLGLQSLRATRHVKLDALALFQCPEAGRLDRGMMNEHFGTIVRDDESKSLGAVEP